jgi:hypothetical protein
VRTGGAVVISDPPSRHRWPADLLSELRVRHHPVDAVSRFDVD